MFTNEDIIMLHMYKTDVREWKSYTTRDKFFKAKDWNGYEALGREIESKWRLIFADAAKKQKLREIEEDVADILIRLSISKNKKVIIKQAGAPPSIRRSSRTDHIESVV